MVTLAGTVRLVRLALRRDRLRLPIWITGMAGGLALSAVAMSQNYPTVADQRAAAMLLAENPATLFLRGPAANASTGALIVNDALWIIGVLTALMSTFIVVRHTRQSEETGRAELVGAAPVGRQSGLAAALIVAIAANATLGILVAGVLAANGLPLSGCLATGAVIGAIGITFAGVAAVTAQVVGGARGAAALAGAVLATTFVLRGVGDVFGTPQPDGVTRLSAWPSWVSPLGWAQRVSPFGANDWSTLTLFLALFALTVGAAFALTVHRDFGLGMIPARAGRAGASRALRSAIGLAWRLQRGVSAAWVLGLVVVGALFGSVGQEAKDLLSTNPHFVETVGKLGGAGSSFIDSFFAAMLALVGAVAAGYVVQALLVVRAEESEGRLEPILATGVKRHTWLLSHIACIVFTIVCMFLLLGLSMGLTYGLATDDVSGQIVALTGAALAQVPAILGLAGFLVALIGVLPRWAEALCWTSFGVALVAGPFGELLNLPDALRAVSPFSHTPAMPAADLDLIPLLGLLALGVLLAAGAFAAFLRRDLATSH